MILDSVLCTLLIAPSVLAVFALCFIQNWSEMRGTDSNV